MDLCRKKQATERQLPVDECWRLGKFNNHSISSHNPLNIEEESETITKLLINRPAPSLHKNLQKQQNFKLKAKNNKKKQISWEEIKGWETEPQFSP